MKKLTVNKILGMLMLVLYLLGIADVAWPISISVTGSWSETINAIDLRGGAGTDLKAKYTSAADAVLISISETTGSTDNWEVDVRKQDTNWPSRWRLFVKRTSKGTGDVVPSFR